MRTFSLGCLAILSTLLGGCLSAHDCYELEVRPEGEAFDRTLTCWHVSGPQNKVIGPVSLDQLVRIGKLYPKPAVAMEARKHVFTGRFRGTTPADVGGAGSYTRFTSSLGSTSAYVERFRGDDDLTSQLAKRREVADRLADFAVGWMAAELGQDPSFLRLKAFLDVEFRRDLKNVVEYTWTGAVAWQSQPDSYYEWLVRLAQYFCERGYFSPQQVPPLLRALNDDDPKPVLSHVQRFLARKMGVAEDRPVPASLAFLDDRARLRSSFDKYARSSPVMRKWLEASEPQQPKASGPAEMTTEQLADALGSELAELIGFEFVFGPDSLDVRLICAQIPYATNGKWDGKGAVTWNDKTLHSGATPPVVCFALWSTPDRAFQEKHFGRLLLSGEPLAEYVTWYRSLGPEQAKEWDEFLDRLRPGPDLKKAVQDFRFRSDPKPDPKKPKEEPASLADTPRRLILTALEGHDGKVILGPGFGQFILIAGGEFTMGRNNGEKEDERPEHRVEFSSFFVGRTPVTTGQFVRFLNEAGIKPKEYLCSQVSWAGAGITLADRKWVCTPGAEDDAACGESWILAQRYCE